MKKLRQILFLVIPIIFALSSCFKQEAKVRFNIAVQSNQAEPVADAVVRISGDEVGKTDSKGKLVVDLKLAKDSRHKIEILKDSSKYYFAPYFDSFYVTEADGQQHAVDATLYFVPKPTAEEQQTVESAYSGSLTDSGSERVDEPLGITETKPTPEQTVVADESGKPSFTEADLPDAPSLSQIPDQAQEMELKPKKVAPNPKKPKYYRHTVYVYSNKAPVANAKVLIADQERGKFRDGCITNSRGRCSMKFPSGLSEQLTEILVTAKRYHSQRQSVKLSDSGKTRFNLPRGESIDVFANLQTFQYVKGLAGVEVYVKGKKVGVTDAMGHLSYIYPGPRSDLVDVTLKSDKALPEQYETDFVVSGPMNLVKHFAPLKAPNVKVAVWGMQIAGELANDIKKDELELLERQITQSVSEVVQKKTAFDEVATSTILGVAAKEGVSRSQLVNEGWKETDLKGDLDAMIIPTLIVSGDRHVELSMVNNQGKVLAAAKRRLIKGSQQSVEIQQAIEAVFKDVIEIFPFEGSVLTRDGKNVSINIGENHKRDIAAGDTFEVFGLQMDKLGKSQSHAKVGVVQITKVGLSSSEGRIESVSPRSTVEVGDILVAVEASSLARSRRTEILVQASENGDAQRGVSQANLYFNENWIGSTDTDGRLRVASKLSGKHGLLRIIKAGYRDFAREMTVAARKVTTVKLSRESAYLQMESKPEGARVLVDGKDYGRTPIRVPVPVPSGFVKLEVGDIKGFKDYKQVLEFEQGTLDLTAGRSIKLETDVIAPAKEEIKKGNYQKAVEILQSINQAHSDFAISRHMLGELLLLNLEKPAQAAAAFGSVTAIPEVKEFVDKRFIGTHVNEGIALVMTADGLMMDEPEAAVSHLNKAVEVLEAVQPQLRFVSPKEYARAVHNAGYYQALAKHRMWANSSNAMMKSEAQRSWQAYLDIAANGLAPASGQESYVQRAKVYYRQVQASDGVPANL